MTSQGYFISLCDIEYFVKNLCISGIQNITISRYLATEREGISLTKWAGP